MRVGVHTGTPLLGEEGYVGHDVHRAARIAASGHGGQVLVSAATAALVALELTDLGEHRFKDLGAPERVFQLGRGEFPPLRSLYRTNLLVPATTFVGRGRELDELGALLNQVRLLTLTGTAGRAARTRGPAQLLWQQRKANKGAEADPVFPGPRGDPPQRQHVLPGREDGPSVPVSLELDVSDSP